MQKPLAPLFGSSIFLAGLLVSCSTLLHRSYDFEDVTKARIPDQTYFDDSSGVFFVEYFNPFADMELLWFSSFIEGHVTLYVYDTATDSLEAIYHFEEQEMPVYTIALHPEELTVLSNALSMLTVDRNAQRYTTLSHLCHNHSGIQYTRLKHVEAGVMLPYQFWLNLEESFPYVDLVN